MIKFQEGGSMFDEVNRRGQVTIFVIVALVIVGGIVLFFTFRDLIFGENISPEFAPIYTQYEQCIKEEADNAIRLLESQGGRIDVGEFLPGNDYNPFSSHLFFLGNPVPYWFGVSGNNLVIDNVPLVSEMENEIEFYISERVNECDFSQFLAQGFFVENDNDLKVDVSVEESRVVVKLNAPLAVRKEDRSARRSSHEVFVDSKLKKLYDAAIDVYSAEKNYIFLENYALDVLQSYAPVDGVEIQCSPKIWKTPDVVKELKDALSANIAAVRFEGPFLREDEVDDKYFTVNAQVNEMVNLMYLPEQFPSKIEVTPASQAVMIAEPVGTQEGLGAMGFCYVPYHFVYDVSFPVLVQIGDGFENFQFPMVVIIDNNLPRNATLEDLVEENEFDVCAFAEGDAVINTYDSKLNPVEADVSYSCFDSLCGLGKTKLSGETAVLQAKIPICLNGQLIAQAEGYADSKVSFSSNSETLGEIILQKEYPVDVSLRMAGRTTGNMTAVVHFTSDEGYSKTAILPESKTLNLKEGLYDIKVFVYGNSNVVIPATRKRECFQVSRGGIIGVFGATKEECVDVEIPSVTIDYALRGGGKTTSYILESELNVGKFTIDVSELPKPTSIEQLQYNHEVFDTLGVQLEFA